MTTDELIEKMSKTKDGHEIFRTEGFKEGYEFFKEHIKKQFPNFTDEEILKFYDNYHTFGKLFGWFYNYEYFTLLRNEIKNKQQ